MSRGDDGMRYILKCKQLMAGLLGLNSGGGLVAKSCLTLETPWTIACQAPLSMRFSHGVG